MKHLLFSGLLAVVTLSEATLIQGQTAIAPTDPGQWGTRGNGSCPIKAPNSTGSTGSSFGAYCPASPCHPPSYPSIVKEVV